MGCSRWSWQLGHSVHRTIEDLGKNMTKAPNVHPVQAHNMALAATWRIEGGEKEKSMAATETDMQVDRFIESFHDAGSSALESVRKFLDTVNSVFPDLSADNGPRKKIIDSAFKMTEQLVGTSTQLAERIVKTSQDALSETGKSG
jgi:hypothetical protein